MFLPNLSWRKWNQSRFMWKNVLLKFSLSWWSIQCFTSLAFLESPAQNFLIAHWIICSAISEPTCFCRVPYQHPPTPTRWLQQSKKGQEGEWRKLTFAKLWKNNNVCTFLISAALKRFRVTQNLLFFEIKENFKRVSFCLLSLLLQPK